MSKKRRGVRKGRVHIHSGTRASRMEELKMRFGESRNPANSESKTAEWFKRCYADRSGPGWKIVLELCKIVESAVDPISEKEIDGSRMAELASRVQSEASARKLELDDPKHIVGRALGMMRYKTADVEYRYEWDKFSNAFIRQRRLIGS